LFDEMRYHADRSMNQDFILNKPQYQGSKIILAGKNFGCGSSREHAPWALYDFGIRCIISTSFADIFYNNCFKNAILPIVLDQNEYEKLTNEISCTATVDLEFQKITTIEGNIIQFDIDQSKKQILLDGIDDISSTMKMLEQILTFERKNKFSLPWLYN